MRPLKVLTLAGLLGLFALASDASACHKKKCVCLPPAPVVYCPPPAPAPVVYCPPPVPVVVCVPVKAKHHFTLPKLGCFKKATPVCAPTLYASYPVCYPSPQAPGRPM